MQFKVVEEISYKINKRRGFHIPVYYSAPYYRVPLKTEPSKNTSISQHNLLCDIKERFPNFDVHYACPMLFTQDDIFNERFLEEEKFTDHLIDNLILADIGSVAEILELLALLVGSHIKNIILCFKTKMVMM